MNTQEPTAEHYLLKALQHEAQGDHMGSIFYYKRAYKLKPELDGVTSFKVDGQEYDQYGELVSVFNLESDRTFKEPFTPTSVEPPKFHPNDPNAAKYLEENGYVVFTQVAQQSEIDKAISLFWDHIESCSLASRDDVSTWSNDNWIGDTTNGIVAETGIGQSPFLWYLRRLPGIKQSFASVWGDDDLLVSFDGCGVFRPVEYKTQWRTRGGWFHIDQNLYMKPGRHCIQGLMNLYKSGEHDGGFVVVPQSQKMMDNAFAKYDNLCPKQRGDYYTLEYNNDIWTEELATVATNYSHPYALKPVKLCLESGDFVMWDSRTVHCNHPPTKLSDDPGAVNRLKRLVAYICMSPTKLASNMELLAKRRLHAFNNGISTTHWPHEYHPTSQQRSGLGSQHKQIKLTKEEFALVVGKELSESMYTAPDAN